MKRVLIATLTLFLIAGSAFANGGGGGRGHGGPGDDGGLGGGDAIVAADGTIFVTRKVTDTATNTSSTQLVAITSAGATAWTATLANRGDLTLSGSNLLFVAEASDGTVNSTITARSTATGVVAWTLTVGGRITDLEPFSGGTYAIVVTPATTTTSATRSVVAISNAGTILWTVAL